MISDVESGLWSGFYATSFISMSSASRPVRSQKSDEASGKVLHWSTVLILLCSTFQGLTQNSNCVCFH